MPNIRNFSIIAQQVIEEIPGTERPAHLFKMPASHVVELIGIDNDSEENFRKGPGAFIIHLLAYNKSVTMSC